MIVEDVSISLSILVNGELCDFSCRFDFDSCFFIFAAAVTASVAADIEVAAINSLLQLINFASCFGHLKMLQCFAVFRPF